jgi:hypothetical protein
MKSESSIRVGCWERYITLLEGKIWHRSKRMLQFPLSLNLEPPSQCRELVPKAKKQIWNHFWLHAVDALREHTLDAVAKVELRTLVDFTDELFA